MKFFDVQSPMFRPIWLRLLIVGLSLAWAIVEFTGGNLFWALVFGGAGLYLAHQFFIVFNPADPEDKDKE